MNYTNGLQLVSNINSILRTVWPSPTGDTLYVTGYSICLNREQPGKLMIDTISRTFSADVTFPRVGGLLNKFLLFLFNCCWRLEDLSRPKGWNFCQNSCDLSRDRERGGGRMEGMREIATSNSIFQKIIIAHAELNMVRVPVRTDGQYLIANAWCD